MKISIIGSGIMGATLARLFASEGHFVSVCERNDTAGGLCEDLFVPGDGVKSYRAKHGPHIFHTSNEKVWSFVNKYEQFIPYDHKVVSVTNDGIIPWPINDVTLKLAFNCDDTKEARRLWEEDKTETRRIVFGGDGIFDDDTFEKTMLLQVGKKLYSMFIYEYTRKHWRKFPADIPAELANRVRVNESESGSYYFYEKYVAIPRHGYTAFVEALLMHPRIHVYTNLNIYNGLITKLLNESDLVFNTGMITDILEKPEEEYLRVRNEFKSVSSLSIPNEVLEGFMVGYIVVNDCTSISKATRYTYYGGLYEALGITDKEGFVPNALVPMVGIEKPTEDGEPLYPVRTKANIQKHNDLIHESFAKYGAKLNHCGRCGSYNYFSMARTIEIAMEIVENYR